MQHSNSHSNSHSNTVQPARPSSPSGRSGGVYGRTELATRYFPYIQPQTAWQKLRSLLAADPALSHLAALRRRTFLPAEVNIIYQHLGQPWTALFRAFKPLGVSCLETLTFNTSNSDFPGTKLRVSRELFSIAIHSYLDVNIFPYDLNQEKAPFSYNLTFLQSYTTCYFSVFIKLMIIYVITYIIIKLFLPHFYPTLCKNVRL
jgi:hypothetical protein